MADQRPALVEGLLKGATIRRSDRWDRTPALLAVSGLLLAAVLVVSLGFAVLGGGSGPHAAVEGYAVPMMPAARNTPAAAAVPRHPQQFLRPLARGWQPLLPAKVEHRLVRQFPRAASVAEAEEPGADAAAAPATNTLDAFQHREAKKEAVLAALEAGSDAAVRAALATTLPALEASNPTANPARGDVLEGKWTVKYTGAVAPGPVDSPTREIALLMYAAGFGPGAAALSLAKRLPDDLVQVETVSLEISKLESRAKMAVSLLQGSQRAEVELLSELVSDGPSKLIETGMEVRVNDSPAVTVPPQVQYKRDLVVTYVDGALLVVRDATGSPDILLRESPPPPEYAASSQPLETVEGDVLPAEA